MRFKMEYEFFSDLYKDVHGFGHMVLLMLNLLTICNVMECQIAQEREEQQKAVDICMSVGASSPDVALRWLEQADYC